MGEEGYLGLDVVRAARISAAGHGGQILISETTRALLGNQLPEGVAVHDLGQQDLKDVQHEHIYELTVDGSPTAPEPPKPPAHASRQEEMAERFGQPTEDGLKIALPFSQDELAGWTGASREAVSKALGALRARGLIRTSRMSVVVKDLDALRARAE